MGRFLITTVLALGASSPVLAQDMPLSQILIDGEGWKKAEGKPEKPRTRLGSNTRVAMTLSLDRATSFVGGEGSQFLWAGPNNVKGGELSGAPYAPLRTRRGEKGIDVTGLATDRDGRIYAATDIGVQVFDPTGRLCGVLTPAAEGVPSHLAFEGDKLTHWVGDTKYARKLNTSGAK